MKPLSIRYFRQIPPFLLQNLTSFFIAGLLLSIATMNGQSPAWIYLKDKPDVAFIADKYFAPAGLERRMKKGIPVGDFYDLPLNDAYIAAITPLVDTIYYASRWLNALAISTTSKNLAAISELPFVTEVQPIAGLEPMKYASDTGFDYSLGRNDSLLLRFQIERMQGRSFAKRQLDGKGITIAVFDIGFKNADSHPAFHHLFKRNAIKATYDFIGDDENLYNLGAHGTAVLGCIAGRFDTIPMGLAPAADFLLARTERALFETMGEEYSWIAAAEWADKHGADIISSSLGYSESRYFQEQMDGRTAPISRAANVAASKGILVINAVGNEAENSWGTIVAPSDADSVLTVGGINPRKDVAISFTSYGPAADGTVKPNISNLGLVYTATPNGFGIMEGTSFSTPLSAGFAACLWQANPHWNNMEVFQHVERSGHLYPYFDYVHGYGIPQAKKALGEETEVKRTFEVDATEDYVNVKVDTVFVPVKNEDGELLSAPKNMYYKIVTPSGRIDKYGVVLVESEEPLYFEMEELQGDESIVIHFEGYTDSIKLNVR